MNIEFERVPVPRSVEFGVFEKFDFKNISEETPLMLTAKNETKTRVSTVLQIGNARVRANFKHDGFNTVEKKEYNHFHAKHDVSNYFKLNKKQNDEVYLEYAKKTIEHLAERYGYKAETIKVKFIDQVTWLS